MTNNSLSDDIYAVGQLMADNLNSVGVSDADVDDGLTTLANKILNASPSGKVNTVLTLNTPMLVYTDNFTVTGVLKDASNNVISGVTIQLIWNDGSEHIATGTTDNDGVFSFTSTDPASVSQYSFQLFFAGDNDYNASNSSVVNVNTSKETSVLSITNPASGAIVSTDSVTVTGTLKDNDGTAMSGKSVSFSLNNVSAGTATVESDGSFSKTVTGLIAGSNSITVNFAATTTHTAASQSITVNRSTFDGLADIELFDGSQILSYADEQQDPYSQYAALETQLMNGDSPAAISGVSVGFYDYSDENNPVLLGSDNTDSRGKASFIYYSTGAGDVPVKAVVGSLLTKTFVVHDYQKYVNTVTVTGSGTLNYHLFSQVAQYQGDAVFSADYIKTDNNLQDGGGLILGDRVLSNQVLSSTAFNGVKLGQYNNTRGFYEYNTSSPTDYRSSATDDRNIKHNLTIIKQNNQLRGIITRLTDNTVIYDRTITPKSDYTYFQLCVWSSAVFVFSDIIIKHL